MAPPQQRSRTTARASDDRMRILRNDARRRTRIHAALALWKVDMLTGIAWDDNESDRSGIARPLHMMRIHWRLGAIFSAFLSTPVWAQADALPVPLEPITVTATRHEERAFDVPASVDIITGAAIRDGQPAVNISETLPR